MVCVCVGTMTTKEPKTETSTWLAGVLLPHPLPQRLAKAIANKIFFALLLHFIPTVSPTLARSANALFLLRC
jgi:hypothetical protein